MLQQLVAANVTNNMEFYRKGGVKCFLRLELFLKMGEISFDV